MPACRCTSRARRRAIPEHGRRFLIEILSLRAGLAFFAATLTVLASPYLVPQHWRLQFVLVMTAQLCGAVIETIAHYFRGLQRSEIESAIHLSYRLTMLVLAMAVLWWWRRLDYLGIAMLVPGVIAMLVSLAIALNLSGSGSREPSTRRATARASLRAGREPGSHALRFFATSFLSAPRC